MVSLDGVEEIVGSLRKIWVDVDRKTLKAGSKGVVLDDRVVLDFGDRGWWPHDAGCEQLGDLVEEGSDQVVVVDSDRKFHQDVGVLETRLE